MQQTIPNAKHRVLMPLLIVTIILSIVLSILGAPMRQVKAATAPTVFRVDANGDITANGTPIRVKGGNWFGLEGRHEPSNDTTNPSGAPMELYMGNVFWNPTTRTYDSDIAEFKAMGINVIRLPVAPQTLSSTDPQGMAPNLKNSPSVVIPNSRLALETVIKKLDAAGIYVLLDIHACSNYIGWRSGRIDSRPPWVDATRDNYDFKREDTSCSATGNPAGVTRIYDYNTTKWLADLQTLAGFETTLGVGNIIGIDIYNEPWDYTWADWKTLSEQAYTAINAVNTNTLIFVEGISDSANNQDGTPATVTVEPSGAAPGPNWGGNLFSAGANPPAIPKNRLVFSPHVYGPSVFVGKQFVDNSVPACVGKSGDEAGDLKCPLIMPPLATMAAGWDSQFGYLKAQGYAIVIGEWGGNTQWPKGAASLRDQARFSYVTDLTLDKQWQTLFTDYLVSKCILDSTYWGLNPESGDTGGLFTTPYDPVSNPGMWGTWGALNPDKMTLVHKLWDVAPGTTCTTGPTLTPTKTITPGGPTNTNTPVPPTATRTNTAQPITPSLTPNTSGAIKVQMSAGGTDNTQQTAFNLMVKNTGSSAVSNISARIYFTTENSNAASSYVLEKYYDQSGVSTVSGPTLLSGSTYYYTVNFGTASLPAGGNWAYNTGMHLSSWASTYSATNDFWHGTGTLPAAFTDWTSVPAYVSGSLVWGSEPGGVVGPTNTPVTPIITATRTNTTVPPILTATRTNTTVPTIITATRTNTPVVVTVTNTPVITATPTSGGTGGTCTPATAVTAPFTFDGAGTFCWQMSNIPGFINSWNATSISINGVNATNLYIGAGSLPAKIGGYYYIRYNSAVAWGHFEAK